MIKDDISILVSQAISAALAAGQLPELVTPEITVERPSKPEHGDYAVSVAMKMARTARMSPFKIAEIIKGHLAPADYIAAVEIAAPGFINFRLGEDWLKSQVKN